MCSTCDQTWKVHNRAISPLALTVLYSQEQIMALTVLCVPYSLDSGRGADLEADHGPCFFKVKVQKLSSGWLLAPRRIEKTDEL